MRNKGVEFSMDAQVLAPPPNPPPSSAGLVLLRPRRNEVVDLGTRPFIITGIMSGQGQSGAPSQRIIPGQSLGTFYGPQFVGVDAAGKQLFNHYVVDANGNRTLSGTTTTPGGDDFVILGDALPDWTLGFRTGGNWNKFDFSMLVNSRTA